MYVSLSLYLSTSGFPLALCPSSGALLSYSLWLLWLAGWRGAAQRTFALPWRGAARSALVIKLAWFGAAWRAAFLFKVLLEGFLSFFKGCLRGPSRRFFIQWGHGHDVGGSDRVTVTQPFRT